MAKNKNRKNNRRNIEKTRWYSKFALPEEAKKLIGGVIFFLIAIIMTLSFFELSGIAGQSLIAGLSFLIGRVVFAIPLILLISGLVFFSTKYKKFFYPLLLAIFILILGLTGILEGLNPGKKSGGWLGYLISLPFLKFFGNLVTQIIFASAIIISGLIFWQLLHQPSSSQTKEKMKEELSPEFKSKTSLIKKIFAPRFKVKEVPSSTIEETGKIEKLSLPELKTKALSAKPFNFFYEIPPTELLETEKGGPSPGDTRINAAIIKKTLQNFDISVEMSEINVGPTVTQYTLKPAEGVKLSKITSLSNDLALALAAHPIRIEAPIPGKSLVGVEVPNKIRARVRLRNLIENANFQKSPSHLTIALGQDVSGNPIYADLSRMPHLLVAGSTGTGKTCAADTLMFTEKGMLTFEELCPLSLNSEKDFKIKLVTRDGIETTSKNYNNGICQFYKLFTGRGYQIEATFEHPLWVINKDGSQGWKAASLIKKGDHVAISRGPGLFGNKIDIADFKPSKIKAYHRKISCPRKMTPQLAQFLGLLTADGGLSVEKGGNHRVTYTQADPHLIRLYKKSLKELFGITRFIEKRSGSNPKNRAFDIVIGSKHLKEFLAYLGMDSWRSPQKEIPRAIREAPKEIVVAYLRALFDNDGYVGESSVELCISSKKLASQVHFMLLNFDIVSSLLIKKVKNYADNEYYKLSILGEEARKFIQEIGFVRKEKYNKIREFLKLSPNPNFDLIPHISSLLKKMGQKYLNRFACLTNRGWKYQSGILVPKYAFSSLGSYNSGFRAPGYQSLEKILDFYQPISEEPEYQELEKISKRNFYWDKIDKIERTSGVGYDFYVPGSDSFVGNGFVNHNTIFLNNLMLSLLYRSSPEILRFILIDPKRVEFPVYNELPHLLSPVIYDANRTVNAFKWLTGEMERRFDVLSLAKSRDITSFNEKVIEKDDVLPYIVVVVDELADLMAAKGKEVEAGIVRLAQMSRAVGIHLVIATQRPSVEVITGLIKANITSRISFQVASQIDSRTVLDMAGAEKLLGLGDLLYLSAEIGKPKRIQSAFVSEKEVKRIVDYIKSKIKNQKPADRGQKLNGREQFSADVEEGVFRNHLAEELEKNLEMPATEFEGYSSEEDPLYEEAKRVVFQARKASASLLQRRLRLGYARAARLIDTLEQKGVVGPGQGAKAREVYIKTEEQNENQNGNQNENENQDWQKV